MSNWPHPADRFCSNRNMALTSRMALSVHLIQQHQLGFPPRHLLHLIRIPHVVMIVKTLACSWILSTLTTSALTFSVHLTSPPESDQGPIHHHVGGIAKGKQSWACSYLWIWVGQMAHLHVKVHCNVAPEIWHLLSDMLSLGFLIISSWLSLGNLIISGRTDTTIVTGASPLNNISRWTPRSSQRRGWTPRSWGC